MKKGYIRTIEAIIAVVLIFIFIISVMPRERIEVKVPKDIESMQEKIIEKIEDDQTLRDSVINYNPGGPRATLDTFIAEMTEEENMDYKFTVCDSITYACDPDLSADLPDKNVYAQSIMIASISGNKIFRLYLWHEV